MLIITNTPRMMLKKIRLSIVEIEDKDNIDITKSQNVCVLQGTFDSMV